MYPLGGPGGDDFFSSMDDFFGGGMGGPMGGGTGGMGSMMGGARPMGGMGSRNPRRGGYSFHSSYDSARPEGQQYQERHEPFGDYAGGGGSTSTSSNEHSSRRRGGAGFMFSGATRADNPAGVAADEQPSYQHEGSDNRGGDANQRRSMDDYRRTNRVTPQYATDHAEYPRGFRTSGHRSGRSGRLFDFGSLGFSSRRRPFAQQDYYEDESDSEDDGARPRQSYAPRYAYRGGGGGGRLFNYDRFGRRG